jgi:primosomal protein N' (replication factor Y) (superfamily II helicase)
MFQETYADLILPLPLNQLFTYRVPLHLIPLCIPGKRAIVQFGAKKIYSAIIRHVHHEGKAIENLKEIIDIMDNAPMVLPVQFSFWDWMTAYYMCTPGEVYTAGIPAGLRLESNTTIKYNSGFFDDEFSENLSLNRNENRVLDALKAGKPLNLTEINDLLGIKNSMPIVKSLVEKGTVLVEEELGEGFKYKTEKYISLTEEFSTDQMLNQAFDTILKRKPRQSEILEAYLALVGFEQEKEPKPIALKEFLLKTGGKPASVAELAKNGIFKITVRNISRFQAIAANAMPVINPLQEFQHEAYLNILELFAQKDTVLLHGVTSSGKTEIYIHLIAKYISEGKQVFYLLPEIALTTQIVDRLRKAFGNRVGVYHSKFSDAERVETYKNLLGFDGIEGSSPCMLVLGVRSAVFLPFKNLGLIIVDEEHESSYKQINPSPRYQARDSALVLARLTGAKTLLGSATPSLETYFNAKSGKYGLVNLTRRYLDIAMPEILLADVHEARRKKQMKSLFTPLLLKEMEMALAQGEQIILFQNRRGFAIYLECHECGWVPRCRYCDVSLTYHRFADKLICHYCGFTHDVYKKCDNCESTNIRTKGFGTEKVEDELKLFFPKATVQRLDLDSAKGKHAYNKIIGDFENGKTHILVGTQMVTKGLDFENVSLVGVLDANQMLNFPDFRAYERSYQLMAQVGGRAGRKNKQGKVVIQTVSPENQIIRQILANNYLNMFYTQAAERRQFNYPPYCRLITITMKHKNKLILDDSAAEFAKLLRTRMEKSIIGPEYPLVGKIYNFYLKTMLVKLEKNAQAEQNKIFIQQVASRILNHEKFKGLFLIYDVDPY